jgi:hypothetical protein
VENRACHQLWALKVSPRVPAALRQLLREWEHPRIASATTLSRFEPPLGHQVIQCANKSAALIAIQL